MVSCGGLIYTIRQVRLNKRRLQLDVKAQVAATNRDLLKLAFSNPELFSLFEDGIIQNESKRRHYIQMWLNHIFLMWEAHEQELLSDSEWYSDKKDIADFFTIKAVSKHWNEVKTFYPPDFVQFILCVSQQSTNVPR